MLIALAVCFSESIVVSAARVPQSPEELVRPATVITAADIERAGQQSLVELLQTLGGVEVSRNGGYGQFSSVFIRGANFNHTLVLVDGIRVSSATSGATAFENIPVNLIERIEIVPGPSSGLYGSDAIGGVVQIFTKRADSTTLAVSAGAGSYATRSFNAGLAGVNVGYFSTGGFSATRPGIPFGQYNPDDDGYRNTNLSARWIHRIGTDIELGANLLYSRGRTWFDSGAGSDDLTDERLQTVSAYVRNRLSPSWESLLRVAEGRDDATTRGSFPSIFNTRQPQVSWQNTIAVPLGTAIAGFEYVRQRVETDNDFATKSRDITSYFAGYSGHYGPHAWQVNARHDDNDQFGGHATGNAAYAYALTQSLRLRLGAGSAFKAPTFNDLYYPGFGNPDLKPERSRSGEAGVDWRTASHAITATYFDNRIEDLIVFDFATSQPQNIANAHMRGTELSWRFESGPFAANIKATFQDHLLPRRAKRHGSAQASYSSSGWTFTGELAAASERFDSTFQSPDTRMGGYGVLNLTAARTLARGLIARIRWNNVGNRDYELARHYNVPKSNVFMEISLSLGRG